MTYIARVTYKQSGYTTVYDKVHTTSTREELDSWIQTTLLPLGKNSSYVDFRVYIGEVSEEYEAKMVFELKPIGNTKKPVKVSETKGLEI